MKKALVISIVGLLVAGIVFSLWRSRRTKEQAQREQTSALTPEKKEFEPSLAMNPLHSKHTPAPPVAAMAPTPQAASKPAPNPAMLNDPETRALMRKQQEQGIIRLADKLVSKEFVRDWKLSPEQAAQVKALVREKAHAGKDLLSAMMFDGLDDNALAQRGRETKQRLDESNAALRGLLGADGFAALTEQEHSLEDRERVKHIREELASAEHPLTSEQQDSLIAAMNAERQGFTFRVDYGDVTRVDFEHMRDYFSEANLQMYFEDLQQLTARIAERAALFLSPEQLADLKTSQQNQLEQARLTVKLTTELFNKRRAN